MKDSLIPTLISGILCMIFLLLPVSGTNAQFEEEMQTEPTDVSEETEETEETRTPFDTMVELAVQTEQGLRRMNLQDYLVGVLLAEVPCDFPQAALEAQAIAARTFALKKQQSGKHTTADVCTDSSCCMGFIEAAPEDYPTLLAAVEATDGIVVAYKDALIDATFFSCDGGTTESALAVWGSDVPYLQTVESPQSAADMKYDEEICYAEDELLRLLQQNYPNAAPQDEPWFREAEYTEGHGLASVEIGGVTLSGTELRSLFSLRSTDIEIRQENGFITFSTRGFGHRVGMSQYGAKAMAEGGSDFEEILTHYYTGVELRRLYCPESCALLVSNIANSSAKKSIERSACSSVFPAAPTSKRIECGVRCSLYRAERKDISRKQPGEACSQRA